MVAVGSRTMDRAREFALANDIGRAHGSYDELLADPEVDAVYISLPNSLHHEWTLRSLAAGKHVLCEKPYTRRPAEVDEAFDAADAAGLVLQEAFMWRHTPQVRRLLELLERIGPVRTIRSTFGYVIGTETDVRIAADLDGGSLMDVGCYCVSGARLVAGEPVRVTARAGPRRERGRAADVGPDALPGRRHGGVHVRLRLGHPRDPGGHRQRRPDPAAGPMALHVGRPVSRRRADPVEPTNPYRLELEDMGAAIRGERPALLGRADALGQARTIEALYRSAATLTPVVLAPPTAS